MTQMEVIKGTAISARSQAILDMDGKGRGGHRSPYSPGPDPVRFSLFIQIFKRELFAFMDSTFLDLWPGLHSALIS